MIVAIGTPRATLRAGPTRAAGHAPMVVLLMAFAFIAGALAPITAGVQPKVREWLRVILVGLSTVPDLPIQLLN